MARLIDGMRNEMMLEAARMVVEIERYAKTAKLDEEEAKEWLLVMMVGIATGAAVRIGIPPRRAALMISDCMEELPPPVEEAFKQCIDYADGGQWPTFMREEGFERN